MLSRAHQRLPNKIWENTSILTVIGLLDSACHSTDKAQRLLHMAWPGQQRDGMPSPARFQRIRQALPGRIESSVLTRATCKTKSDTSGHCLILRNSMQPRAAAHVKCAQRCAATRHAPPRASRCGSSILRKGGAKHWQGAAAARPRALQQAGACVGPPPAPIGALTGPQEPRREKVNDILAPPRRACRPAAARESRPRRRSSGQVPLDQWSSSACKPGSGQTPRRSFRPSRRNDVLST